jgi:hypothetical protein
MRRFSGDSIPINVGYETTPVIGQVNSGSLAKFTANRGADRASHLAGAATRSIVTAVAFENEPIAAQHRGEPAARERLTCGESERLAIVKRNAVCSCMHKRIADR